MLASATIILVMACSWRVYEHAEESCKQERGHGVMKPPASS